MNPNRTASTSLAPQIVAAWAIVFHTETGFPTVAERMINGCTCAEALADIDEWANSFGESAEHAAARAAIRTIYGS